MWGASYTAAIVPLTGAGAHDRQDARTLEITVETKRTTSGGAPIHRPLAEANKEQHMLHYAVVFLVIALIAAVFGFGGIAAGAVGIAKILFFVFVIMAVVTFVISLIKRG